jgi:hypothetical protein
VLDSVWQSPPSADIDSQLVARNQWYEQFFASNKSDTGALIPFIYQNIASLSLYGAVSLPQTQQEIKTFFGSLKTN